MTELLTPLAEQGEKATPIAGTAATHQPTARERLQLLLNIIRAQAGEWTTLRVRTTYRALGVGAVYSGTYRRDLTALHRAGHLARHGDGTPRRFYTLKGGAA